MGLRVRLLHDRKQFRAVLGLLPLGLKLISNSIIRDHLRRYVTRRISRKLGDSVDG